MTATWQHNIEKQDNTEKERQWGMTIQRQKYEGNMKDHEIKRLKRIPSSWKWQNGYLIPKELYYNLESDTMQQTIGILVHVLNFKYEFVFYCKWMFVALHYQTL